MKKQTATERYIRKAVTDAKKEFAGTRMGNVSVVMNMEASGATEVLASALMNQAMANKANSEAMLKLAQSLKPTDACAIKIVNDRIDE